MTSARDARQTGPQESIAFSSFRLDRRGGQLMRAGVPIALRPKTWTVLLYLAERPGVLVTRDELLDAIWPDVAVTPDTLTKSIGELRLALGDDSRTPRFIETVHRRGFRFIDQPGSAPPPEAGAAAWREGGARAPPFVGRASEIGQLADRFARAAAGDRQVVFVTGPAGVGKTTLVEAFLDSPAIHGVGLPVWVGRGACVEQHGPREPYMPVLDALGRLARRADRQRLIGLLRHAAPTWLAQMPWLLDGEADALRQSLHVVRPERMLREFAVLTEALTTDLTLVLVLEDLHWSDPSTVDLVALLGQRREPARLLVIGTYRPAEAALQEHGLTGPVRTLQLRRQCAELPVHDLTEADVRKYLETRFPHAQFPPTLARVLHAQTDGNPLFVTAVVEHMLSRGWILETSPGWSLTMRPETIDLGVPDDARRMIATQYESLAPADRTLLAAASIAGNEFVAQAIAAPLGRALDDVEARCESLARSQRFLRFATSGEWPDGSVVPHYAFTHELYRKAVYEEVPAGSRERLHRRIGETLETAYGERATEIAGELATHFERGGDHRRALRYLAIAAARARQRFASREAVGHLEAARALAARLPDEGERRQRELDLRLALAPTLSDLYGFASEELRENCERAYEICAAVGDPTQLFQVLYALSHCYAVRADQALAPPAEAKLDDLARRLGTAEHRLLADTVLARSAANQGRFGEACRLVEGPLSAHLQGGVCQQPPSYGADPVIVTNCHYAFALWFLGYTDRAKTIMRASLAAVARPGATLFTKAAALTQMGILELLCRNPDEVRDLAEQVSSLTAEQGFRYWSALASALKGWVRVQHGELREGIEELEQAQAALAATGARIFSTHILAFRTEAHLRAGEVALGLAAVEEGLRIAETTLDRSYWPELWRLKGELLLAGSQSARRAKAGGEVAPNPSALQRREAERCLLNALKLARQTEAKSLELRAATSLARAWQAWNRVADARAVLDGICRWFEAGTTSPDLNEARALLRRLTPSAPSRPRRPAAASPQAAAKRHRRDARRESSRG